MYMIGIMSRESNLAGRRCERLSRTHASTACRSASRCRSRRGRGRDPQRPLTRAHIGTLRCQAASGPPRPIRRWATVPELGRPPRAGRRKSLMPAEASPAGPRHAACGGPVRAHGPSRPAAVGRRALHAAASAPMSSWGGSAAATDEEIRPRLRRSFVLVRTPPPPPGPRGVRGVAAGLGTRGGRPPRAAPVPASAEGPPRPRSLPGRARPGPAGGVTPRPGRPPGPPWPVGPRGLHAARMFNNSYLNHAGNPLFYRVFR